MKAAIIGSGGAGKSTLLTLLNGGREPGGGGSEYVSGVAAVPVPDPRVGRLAEELDVEKRVYARVELHDFDGFGRLWSEQKAGKITNLAAAFDSFILVVNGYSGAPGDDEEQGRLRLVLTDLSRVEDLLPRVEKEVQGKEADPLYLALTRVHQALQKGVRADEAGLPSGRETAALSGVGLLTLKPLVVLHNVETPLSPTVETAANLKLELEALELEPHERDELILAYGFKSGIEGRLLRTLVRATGLATFFTANDREVRAWLTPENSTAQEAAFRIHEDLGRGFIRAEVTNPEGETRTVGKDYTLKDGDRLEVRFSA